MKYLIKYSYREDFELPLKAYNKDVESDCILSSIDHIKSLLDPPYFCYDFIVDFIYKYE